MSTFGIIVQQVGLFAIYMVIGFILVKVRVFNEETLEPLSKFVLKLALPVLIFVNTTNGVTRTRLFESLPILWISVLFYIIIYFLALLMTKLFRLKGDTASVYRAVTMFGNIGYMGIPIVISIFPETGMLYISIFTIIDQLVLWTLGVKLTSSSAVKFSPIKLVNPSTVAIVLAIVLILTGISVPSVLNTALEKVGAIASPLAMIYLGGVFACVNFKIFFTKIEYYGLVAVKMIALPIVFFFILKQFPIADDIRMTLALIPAMPSMAALVMMTKSNGSDGDYSMGAIFISTVCSLVTIPLVCFILEHI